MSILAVELGMPAVENVKVTQDTLRVDLRLTPLPYGFPS